MENVGKISKLESKKIPESVLLEVFLQRHGPKLSATAEKNEVADYFGASVEQGFEEMGVKEGKGLVHISSSPVERAMNTATIELEKMVATEHRLKKMVGKQEKLATPFQPFAEAENERYAKDLEIIIKMQRSLEHSAREKVEHDYPNLTPVEKEAEVRNIIDTEVLTVLFDEKKAKEHGIQTSYEEMADNLAQRYEGFLKHARLLASQKESDMQPKDEPYRQIDVSHSFPIMSFLKKFLVFDDGLAAREMTPPDFFNKIGGVIKESQSLKLRYKKEGERYILEVEGNFQNTSPFRGQLKFTE